MNPDPNQPSEQPQSQPEVSVPQAPVTETPTVETPVTPAPVADAPAANPFGAPVPAAEPVANPFGAAPVSSHPAAPAQPVALGSAPVGSPAPAPAPSKKKLVILISAIVGGLLVLGGAALAVYLLFFTVTKADYQKAFDQVSIVRDLASTTNLSTSTSDEDDDAETAVEVYDKFKTENAKLGDLKAYKVDKELKEKYDAYNVKAKAYITFADGFMPSVQAFSAATKQIAADSKGASAFSSVTIQKTIDAYKAANVTEPTLKAFVDAMIAAYEKILPQIKITESSTSTTAEKRAATTVILAATKDISAAGTAFSKDLKEKTDEVKFSDELNELGKLTTTKLHES